VSKARVPTTLVWKVVGTSRFALLCPPYERVRLSKSQRSAARLVMARGLRLISVSPLPKRRGEMERRLAQPSLLETCLAARRALRRSIAAFFLTVA
jgi:hypothetical protein